MGTESPEVHQFGSLSVFNNGAVRPSGKHLDLIAES